MDFSLVTDGAKTADETIAKSGLAIAALHALEAQANGSSFPELPAYTNRVVERLKAKHARIVEKYGDKA